MEGMKGAVDMGKCAGPGGGPNTGIGPCMTGEYGCCTDTGE